MSEMSLEPMTRGEEIRVLRLALEDARACSRELGAEVERLRGTIGPYAREIIALREAAAKLRDNQGGDHPDRTWVSYPRAIADELFALLASTVPKTKGPQ